MGARTLFVVCAIVVAGFIINGTAPDPGRPLVATAAVADRPNQAPEQATGEAPAQLLAGRRVLLLLSYDPTFPTSTKIVQAVAEALSAAGVRLKVEYLDSKTQWDAEFVDRYSELLDHKLGHEAPYDLVITADDNAAQLLLDHRIKALEDVPVVSMGINDRARMRQLQAAPGMTGIYEAPSLAATVALAARLFPAADDLVVIVDGTVSGQGDLSALRAPESGDLPLQLQVLSLGDLTWAELGERLAALDDSSVLLLLSAYKDRDGRGKPFSESLALIRSQSSRPIFHLWEHGLGEGVLGGISVSHSAQARQAAAMAVQILSGAPPSALPAIWEFANVPMFDDRELWRFGVAETALPEGSLVFYRPDTLMSRYGHLVIGAGVVFLLLAGTILTLLLLIHSRKQALLLFAESQRRFELAGRFAGFGVWELDTATRRIVDDKTLRDLLGYGPGDDLQTLADWLKIVPASDQPKVRSIFADILNGRTDAIQFQFLAQRKDGALAHLELQAVVRRDQGRGRLIGFSQDVTELIQARQAIVDEREFLQAIIDGIGDPLMVIDRNYQILKMNQAARSASTHVREAGLSTCYRVSHGQQEPCASSDHPCPLQQVLETGSAVKVVHNHPVAGENRTLEIVGTPLRDKGGRIIGIIETTHDITDYLGVIERLHERDLAVAHLENHDQLTGLPNRVLFTDRLRQAIDRARRNGSQMAVLFVDLDRFQRVNESFGHPVGDEVIKIAARRFATLVHRHDILARIGGDDFILFLRHLDKVQDAAGVARAILNDLAHPFVLPEHSLYLSASVGISVYPQDGDTVDLLVSNADAAMHKAKESGRNTFAYYTEDMTKFARERLNLEAALRTGIARDELAVYYQPQVDLRDGCLVGAEALVRWRHPTLGIVSPDAFIGVAEETGIIVELGRRVLVMACRQMREWLDTARMPPDGTMSVNLSARQFDELSLGDDIVRILAETELDPHRLELEITESLLMTHRVSAESVLWRLRALGIGVAIDDFGTGYSSLSYLKRLPITKLKIDRSFVTDIPKDHDNVVITQAVIGLARSLGLQVIAEGVETVEERAYLTAAGCHFGQGYLFSKPIPAPQFETFAAKQG